MADVSYVPQWFTSFTPKKIEYHALDSFGFQYAVCEANDENDYERCDLRAYVPGKGDVKYGEYYAAGAKYAVVIPPNVYRYSGYDELAYVIKGDKVQEYKSPSDLDGADYVVVEKQ